FPSTKEASGSTASSAATWKDSVEKLTGCGRQIRPSGISKFTYIITPINPCLATPATRWRERSWRWGCPIWSCSGTGSRSREIVMSTFPGSPRVQKGALVGADPLNPLASVVIFQYNPDALTRTLVPQTAGGNSPGEALRLKGPPQETIKLDA